MVRCGGKDFESMVDSSTAMLNDITQELQHRMGPDQRLVWECDNCKHLVPRPLCHAYAFHAELLLSTCMALSVWHYHDR